MRVRQEMIKAGAGGDEEVPVVLTTRPGETLPLRYMRRVGLGLSALLGASLLTFAPAATPIASAAPTDVIAVVVEGTGYGHGRGMSQWGAYGWAVDQGWNWVQILDHYYGGTVMSDVDTSQTRIRVQLKAWDAVGTIGVTSGSGGVTVADTTGPRWNAASIKAQEISPNVFAVYASAAAACPASSLTVPDGPISQNSTNRSAVEQIQTFLNAFQGGTPLSVDGGFGNLTATRLREWQTAQALPVTGAWDGDDAGKARLLISIGGAAAWTPLGNFTGPLAFSTGNGENSAASPDSVLALCNGAGGVTHYRGSLEFRSEVLANRVLNDVKTEDYLRGVVPKEISASWTGAGGGRGMQAVMAQAVAARSYALQPGRWSDAICDTQSCQVYFGAGTRSSPIGSFTKVEYAETDSAIVATVGKVRRWPGSGAIVSTEFSASNGPRTAGGAFPPVDDAPGDGTASNPNHKWTRIFDAPTLAAQNTLGTLTGATMVDGGTGYDGIWNDKLVLSGTGGTRTITADSFRISQGLPSAGFTVRVVTRDSVTSSVAMIGDSVGNSIAGASNSEFRILSDGTFPALSIDVLDSRFINKTPPSTSGVQAAASVPLNTALAVVELGYNPGSNPAADIDAMMAALQARAVRQVAWVNLADIRTTGNVSTYGPTNAALEAARSRWPNLTILDWNGASGGPERPRWFSDGVHLTNTGQAQFALWLRQSIVSLSPSIAGRLAPPRRIEIPVVGRTVTAPDGTVSTIPANVTAVSLNVAAVSPDGDGFVTVWPCAVTRPLTSNLNYTRGAIDGNGVIAPVDANGKACVYSHVGTDAVIDIAGWFGPTDSSGSGFTAITPKRLIDSREGIGVPLGLVRPEAPVTLAVVGAGVQMIDGTSVAIPPNAVAAAINVTAVTPSGPGYITVWPCGVDRPVVSTVNFNAGAIRANGAIAPLGVGGTLCFYSHAPTDLVVDVVGWFTAGASPVTSAFVSAVPQRWVDTREGLGSPVPVTPAQPLTIGVTGRQMVVNGQAMAIPGDAESVSLNITVVDPPGPGFITVWPCGTTRPLAASLNFPAGKVTANNVIATIGAGGSVCVYAHSPTQFVVDVNGWFNRTDTYAAVVPDRVVDTRYGVGPGPI